MLKLDFETFAENGFLAVLSTLDDYAREVTRCPQAKGWQDEDLKVLHAALEEHFKKLAHRMNASDSDAPGSADIHIIGLSENDSSVTPVGLVRSSPSCDEVKTARLRAQAELACGVTAAQDWCAAQLSTTRRVWQQWEAGDRRMHSAFWELFESKLNRLLP